MTSMLLIDASTGTVLTAETCYLLPDDAITEAEWEAFNDMSDNEATEIARARGIPVLPRA